MTKTILAQGRKDGTVKLHIGTASTSFPARDAGKIALMILQASQEASYLNGFNPETHVQDDGLQDVIGAVPDGIGVTGRDAKSPNSLIVQFGYTRFALGMGQQQTESLSLSIQTLSAPEGRKM